MILNKLSAQVFGEIDFDNEKKEITVRTIKPKTKKKKEDS